MTTVVFEKVLLESKCNFFLNLLNSNTAKIVKDIYIHYFNRRYTQKYYLCVKKC